MDHPKIGIALGGGGVRGLAHLPLLRVLDELDIVPSYLVGTSMGAIVGALYAAGLKAEDIEQRVREHIILKEDRLRDVFDKGQQLITWVRAFGPDFSTGGIMTADGLFKHLFNELLDIDFAQLHIPFQAVACDYWSGEQIALDQGPVLDAVQASMAVPGVFAPVKRGGRLLVDGGVVNNLPYELIPDECDLSIALELTNLPVPEEDDSPSALEIAVGALDLMQIAALRQRLTLRQPDILIRPQIQSVGMFDFNKIERVLKAGESAAVELKSALESRLSPPPSRV